MYKKTTKSKKLYNSAIKLMPGGVNSPVRSFSAVTCSPIFISRAKGPYVYDVDGNKYIDYMSSWGPLILGHSHPDVIKAIKDSANKGTSYGLSCEYELTLAKLIIKNIPSIEVIRMTNSGTEATMSAVRLARAFTKRDFIIKFEGCYHGHADYLLVQAGSGATTFGTPSSPGVPKDFTRKTLLAKYNDIESVEKLFNKYKNKIAGIIIEPVAGNMGVVLPAKNFLKNLKKLTKTNGSMLIFDEVITGLRLGMGGAQKLFGVSPDITCLGKIIGGGLPVGAYGARKGIMDMVAPVGPMYQAGTLSGNPLAMAAGIATLNKLNRKREYIKLNKMTEELVEGLKRIITELGIEAQLNSIGSMFTLFFTDKEVNDYRSALKSNTHTYAKFFKYMLLSGIIFPPSQFEAVFVSMAHKQKNIDRTLNAAYDCLKNL